MEYQGTIVRIKPVQTVSDKFRKREFCVTDNAAQYPNTIQFELHQDRVDLIEPFKEGEMVNIKFNLKGRDWTDKEGVVKTFNTLQAWSLTKAEGEKFKGETTVPDDGDGLPF